MKVRILDLSFLYKGGKTFPDFVVQLIKSTSATIYDSTLVQNLLSEFWDFNFYQILYWQFFPFALHLVFTMTWLVLDMQPGEKDHISLLITIVASLSAITCTVLVYQEISQLVNKKNEYWSFMNLIDIGHLSLLILIIVVKVT